MREAIASLASVAICPAEAAEPIIPNATHQRRRVRVRRKYRSRLQSVPIKRMDRWFIEASPCTRCLRVSTKLLRRTESEAGRALVPNIDAAGGQRWRPCHSRVIRRGLPVVTKNWAHLPPVSGFSVHQSACPCSHKCRGACCGMSGPAFLLTRLSGPLCRR